MKGAIALAESVRARLRLPSGLYTASVSDWYSRIWIRDNVYCALPDLTNNGGQYAWTIRALMDLIHRAERERQVLTRGIARKPGRAEEHIHIRYLPDGSESPEGWGHEQYDAYGALLWAIGEGERRGIPILRGAEDRKLLRQMVLYLHTCQFWGSPDNGMWEEAPEVHASSIGACQAGLSAILPLLDMPHSAMAALMVCYSEQALAGLLPNESATKAADLALLSLFRFGILTPSQETEILRRVESELIRPRGVIRYHGDQYHAKDGREAEWPMGLYMLSEIHANRGDRDKALTCLAQADAVCLSPDKPYPELYPGGQAEPGPNTPLGWTASMSLLARQAIAQATERVA